MAVERTLILNAGQIDQKITRMAHEIYENYHRSKDVVLIGVSGNGSILADKICAILKEISPLQIHRYDISLDKDNPLSSDIKFTGNLKDLKNKYVILVDDVLNSGRTLIYATRFLLESELKMMTVATLVDRFHRRFPIRAEVVGLTLSTNIKEHVNVDFTKGSESVHLEA
jgi:pyrimidine operon attenuation protein / uracil phosphoribosyltransferase